MAGGVDALGDLQGKVDSNNGLVVVSQAQSGAPTKTAPIVNLPGKVDSTNALVVTVI